jgi:tetratricopeptide (TPR) repeat protein
LSKDHVLTASLGLVLVFMLAMRIDAYNHAFAFGKPVQDVPVFTRFLGEARSMVSNVAILQADRYYHGGVGHLDEHQCGKLWECDHDHEHDEKRLHVHEKEARSQCGRFNVLMKISEQIELTEHIHLEGGQVKEIVPWLYYAARVDPHNILAYTLSAFYLADKLGKTDQAMAFLREGLRKNPDAWEINAEIGRIYFQYYKNYDAAAYFLNAALQHLNETPHDKFDERRVVSLLAHTYEAMGETGKALPLYRRLNELFPGKVHEGKTNNTASDR